MSENNGNLTFFSWKFWNLVLMKLVRNFSSMKFQLLILMYIPIIYGIFTGQWSEAGEWQSKISAETGLAFLGGGYVTLALGRIYARTKLNGQANDQWMDTDS